MNRSPNVHNNTIYLIQSTQAQSTLATQAGLDGRNFTSTGFPTGRNFTPANGNSQPSPSPAPAPLPAPAQQVAVKTVAEDDQSILEKLIGKTCVEQLIKLDLNSQNKTPMLASERTVTFAPITERTERASLHHVGFLPFPCQDSS